MCLQTGQGTRNNKQFVYSSCGSHKGCKYAQRTAGASWAMLQDGYLFPPVEMPDAESKRMTMLNMIAWFEGYEYPTGVTGLKLVIVYDEMCHLLRCVFAWHTSPKP